MPKAPVHGGSMMLASVGTAVVDACKQLMARLPVMNRPKVMRPASPHRLESLTAAGHS
jgi:hypothetical protein